MKNSNHENTGGDLDDNYSPNRARKIKDSKGTVVAGTVTSSANNQNVDQVNKSSMSPLSNAA
jgi:hypothetical protein